MRSLDQRKKIAGNLAELGLAFIVAAILYFAGVHQHIGMPLTIAFALVPLIGAIGGIWGQARHQQGL